MGDWWLWWISFCQFHAAPRSQNDCWVEAVYSGGEHLCMWQSWCLGMYECGRAGVCVCACVCLCVLVCVYVCVCVCVFEGWCLHIFFVCVCMCVGGWVDGWMGVCVCVCVCVCVRTDVCMCLCVRANVCVCVFVCVCVCSRSDDCHCAGILWRGRDDQSMGTLQSWHS